MQSGECNIGDNVACHSEHEGISSTTAPESKSIIHIISRGQSSDSVLNPLLSVSCLDDEQLLDDAL